MYVNALEQWLDLELWEWELQEANIVGAGKVFTDA